MKNKKYQAASLTFVTAEPRDSILTGSVTNIDVTVSSVTVEPFQAGFSDSEGNDFATISFD